MEQDRQPRPLIEVEEVSENIRVFSTEYVQDDLADAVVSGILAHPYIESARPILGRPLLSIEVVVSEPAHWDMYIDPHCREVISSAMDF
jgi:hypothetical protein